MKGFTIFLGLCVAFTVILAAPSGNHEKETQTFGLHANKDVKKAEDQEIKTVILLQRLSRMTARNYFEDLIQSQFNMSVKEFLESIDATFKNLDKVTKDGITELNGLLSKANPEVKVKIEELRDKSIAMVFRVIGGFLEDLGLVLPALGGYSVESSAAEIIYALLRKTLEEFVRGIANAMEQSMNLLDETMEAFQQIATIANPEIAVALRQISDNYWNQGRTILKPKIDQLRSLLDYNAILPTTTATGRSLSMFGVREDLNKDLLVAAVSSTLEIDIETAAFETKIAIAQFIALIQSVREQIDEALYSVYTSDNKVQMKVMDIYDDALGAVIRDLKPIFESLLQFRGTRNKTFTIDLVSSLIGIGADDFKKYLKDASSRIDSRITRASSEILAVSAEDGMQTAIKVAQIMQNGIESAKQIAQPLVYTMGNLLEPKSWNRIEMDDDLFSVSQMKGVNEWLEGSGLTYNRDRLIGSVSNILEFDVVLAVKTLKASLEKLDNLVVESLGQLEIALSKGKGENLRNNILKVLNQYLTDVHITLQPILDVILSFLPDQTRSNREVALDFYNSINGVNVHRFKKYIRSAAERIQDISYSTKVKIIEVMAGENHEVENSVVELLENIDVLSKEYVKPFLEILKPVLAPSTNSNGRHQNLS